MAETDWTPRGEGPTGPLVVCALLRGVRRAALQHRMQEIKGTAWATIADAVSNTNGNGATKLVAAMKGLKFAGMDEEHTRRELMGEIVRWDSFVNDWLADDIEFIRRRGLPDKTLEEVSGMFEEVDWLWKDWIPRGFLSMICGRPGVGKTYVACWIGANMVGGGTLPDGSHSNEDPETATVIWIDTEGSHAILVQRMKRLAVPQSRFRWPLDPKHPADPFPIVDFAEKYWMDVLMDYAIEKKPAWIVVDSLRGAHSSDENSSDVQTMLGNTAAIARDVGCGFTFIHHLRKSNQWDGGEVTLDQVRGSSAIGAMARVMIALDQPDPHGPELRLRVIKSNLSVAPEPCGLMIKDMGPVALDWTPSVPRAMTSVDRACEFLQARLASAPRKSEELNQEAEALGITRSAIQRARAKLVLNTAKRDGVWWWSLPPRPGQRPAYGDETGGADNA